MAEPMKFLTIRQPWASLIAVGAKTIETRPFSTTYRGPLAIHAGKAMPREGDEVGNWTVERWRDDPSRPCMVKDSDHQRPDDLPLGAVVAVCDLVDVVPIGLGYPSVHYHGPTFAAPNVAQDDHPRPTLGMWYCTHDGHPHYEGKVSRNVDDQLPFGDFTPGRYAWLLDNVRPIEPVPMKGAQGLRDVPADVLERLA